jgi:hypothetical protein
MQEKEFFGPNIEESFMITLKQKTYLPIGYGFTSDQMNFPLKIQSSLKMNVTENPQATKSIFYWKNF